MTTTPTEVTAREKFPCPACGAQAEWNPAKQKLICPFCGTESDHAIPQPTGAIAELDVAGTLSQMSDALRGWQAEKRSVQCQSCHAVMVFDPNRAAQNCEFCGSPALVDYTEAKDPISPQSLLAFRVPDTQVRERIRQWYGSKWFAPRKLRSRGLVDTLHGVYLPYWTFDAHVDCPWRAEAGYHYYTTENYRDSNGRLSTRQVQQVRWEPASGRVQHFFNDELVAGSKGVPLDVLRRIEPFPTEDLVPYDAAMVSGFVVERYQVGLEDAAKLSLGQMTSKLRVLCANQIPGDEYRNLEMDPHFSGHTFKHILVPVWMLTYTYGPRSFQVLVNGYTGQMEGKYPVSPWKVAAAVLLAVIVLLFLLFLQSK